MLELKNFLSIFKTASEQLSADITPTPFGCLVVYEIERFEWMWRWRSFIGISVREYRIENIGRKIHLRSLHYIAIFLHPVAKKFSVSQHCNSDSAIIIVLIMFTHYIVNFKLKFIMILEEHLLLLIFTKINRRIQYHFQVPNNHQRRKTRIRRKYRWWYGTPARSATAERIFSSSDRMLEEGRRWLSSKVVDDVLTIRDFRNMVSFALSFK